ncbi:MAG: peptidoglycan-binding protein [Oscillospiraceae bacterium]|nr:peptidoglycan-binding protein [Oscillospiraceae bacterium]
MRPTESFIEQPIRSLQTMLQIISEDDPRLPNVIPDGIYDAQTVTAVTAFQMREGLPQTGIADQTTWDRIVIAYEPALIRVGKAEPIEIIMDAGQVFRIGDSNPYIYLLQSILTQLSKDSPGITAPNHSGTFDGSTADALTEFQLLADLPATGELDKITWKHLVHQFTLNAHHDAAVNRSNA